MNSLHVFRFKNEKNIYYITHTRTSNTFFLHLRFFLHKLRFRNSCGTLTRTPNLYIIDFYSIRPLLLQSSSSSAFICHNISHNVSEPSRPILPRVFFTIQAIPTLSALTQPFLIPSHSTYTHLTAGF